MKKICLFVSMFLLVALTTSAFSATAYRKFTTDEATVPMLTITPDPTKVITLADSTVKATYCLDTSNILQFMVQTTRTTSMYPNTLTTKTFPINANTPYTIGVARYGTGNSHTVTQMCFTNQSGASLSIMPQ